MRKIVKFRIVNILLILTCIGVLILESVLGVFLIANNIFWFVLLLLTFGISELFKFIIFHSDSSLWFAITMILLTLIYIAMIYANISIERYYPILLISPIIASLFIGLIFKDVLQLKVVLFIVNLLVILLLFSFDLINLLVFITILVVTNIVLFATLVILPNKFAKLVSKE